MFVWLMTPACAATNTGPSRQLTGDPFCNAEPRYGGDARATSRVSQPGGNQRGTAIRAYGSRGARSSVS